MYFTDRGIEELADRRGEEQVSVAWLAERLRDFVDLNPDFETAVDRLATWLARLDDDEDLLYRTERPVSAPDYPPAAPGRQPQRPVRPRAGPHRSAPGRPAAVRSRPARGGPLPVGPRRAQRPGGCGMDPVITGWMWHRPGCGPGPRATEGFWVGAVVLLGRMVLPW